jgi:energy-coupling factor transporter ATP-binding protein EcfA2
MTEEEKRLRGFAVFIIQWLDQTGQSDTFTREVTDLVLNYGYTVDDAKERVEEILEWRRKVLGEM